MAELIFDIETTGLDPFSDMVIAIGYSTNKRATVLMGDEKEILMKFSKMLKRAEKVVGFNITDFDMPFLLIRCIKHSVAISFPEAVDLSKLSPHRKRLEDWCRFLNIKRTYELNGSRILELYLKGKLDLVKKHCLDDVKAAREVWSRYKLVMLEKR